MTNSRSMRISVGLVFTLALGCHSIQPASNPPAGQQVQQDNGKSSSIAAGANAAPAGAPGGQQNSSAGSSNAGSQVANTGPALSTRPTAGTNTPAAIQSIDVPSGTLLKIRLNESLNVKRTQTGQAFTGSVVDAIAVAGSTAIQRGASVTGVVDRSHRRGHFKGASVLVLRLTSLDQDGQHYRIDTRDVVRTKKGKGRRTAGFIGGGAGLGMLIGGVATGGVGLLVGGLAGGGAGTLGAAFTGNRDITIPAESVLTFRLADSILIRP